MSIFSSIFLVFIIVFLLLYFIVPKKIQKYIILMFSYIFIFYNNFNIYSICSVLLILFISYYGAKLINKYNKKIYLIISVFIILSEFICIKYLNLYNLSVYSTIGFSYYTLIMIGYLIEVYRDNSKYEKNILKLATFMNYFPIVVSGPFIRIDNIKEINSSHKFSFNRLLNGLLRILWGIFKVLVISNKCEIIINYVYSNLSNFSGIFVFIAILLYTIQLYTNFSGSIDIIIGISSIIGVYLPENFDCPFSSKSISEFWRRWHITLGSWLRDYLFYPLLKSDFIQNMITFLKKYLGNNIGKKIPTYLCMLLLWISVGLWHGAKITYVFASGIIQFIYIVVGDITKNLVIERNNRFKINENSKFYNIYLMLRTFILFSLSMVFFKANSFTEGFDILKSIFNYNMVNSFNTLTLSIVDIIILILSIITLLYYDFNSKFINEKLEHKSKINKLSLILILLLFVLLFGTYGIGFNHSEFIYSNF